MKLGMNDHFAEIVLQERSSGRYLAFAKNENEEIVQGTIEDMRCAYKFSMLNDKIRNMLSRFPKKIWKRIGVKGEMFSPWHGKHEYENRRHRTRQKLKEWGYRKNETEQEKCCGSCAASRVCEHIEGFYPEVLCGLLDILHLVSDEISYLGICNRYRE